MRSPLDCRRSPAPTLDLPAGDGWLQAMAELYAYRRANDEVAVLAHQSLEFLARVLFEVDS